MWAIWDDNKKESWMRAKHVRLASRFIVGDTIKIGKRIITVDGIVKFNDKRGILIARKRLI